MRRGKLFRVIVAGVGFFVTMAGAGTSGAALPKPAARFPSLLGRIPANAGLYIYTTNMAALDAKMRLMQGHLRGAHDFDPIAMIMREFGPNSAINFSRPAAIAVLSWPKPGAMVQPTVVAFLASNKPTATLAALSAKLVGKGIYQGALTQPPMPMFMAVSGNYVIMSDQAAGVRKCLAAKKFLASRLSPALRHYLATSDLTMSLQIAPVYQLYHQELAMMAQVNGGAVKKTKRSLNLSGPAYYEKADAILAKHGLHRMVAEVPRLMFNVSLQPHGLLYRLIAVPRPGTAMARLFAAQGPLGKLPFVGLPAGRYVAAGAWAINGSAVAAWLHGLEAVWQKHVSIRTRRRFAALKMRWASIRTALTDFGGISLISYVGTGKTTQSVPGILVVNMAHAAVHLHNALAWLKHPVGWPGGPSPWLKVQWTMTPHALRINGVNFTKVAAKFPPQTNTATVSAIFSVPSPRSIFGANHVSVYVGAINHRIILAEVSVAKKLPMVVAQIQKYQQNLDSLADIAELAALRPAAPTALFYLPLARWASLARQQTHPGGGQPIAGAVVIGVPVPPMLVSESVVGGCLVYRAYISYSLMSTIHDTSILRGMPF